MQFDLYLPKENLAFEFQGQHHFRDIYALENKWESQEKDKEKRELCLSKGITLIEIPYWWDFKLDSLKSTIYQQRKDLIPICDGKPILFNQYFEINSTKNEIIELMHGEEWNGDENIEGW